MLTAGKEWIYWRCIDWICGCERISLVLSGFYDHLESNRWWDIRISSLVRPAWPNLLAVLFWLGAAGTQICITEYCQFIWMSTFELWRLLHAVGNRMKFVSQILGELSSTGLVANLLFVSKTLGALS